MNEDLSRAALEASWNTDPTFVVLAKMLYGEDVDLDQIEKSLLGNDPRTRERRTARVGQTLTGLGAGAGLYALGHGAAGMAHDIKTVGRVRPKNAALAGLEGTALAGDVLATHMFHNQAKEAALKGETVPPPKAKKPKHIQVPQRPPSLMPSRHADEAQATIFKMDPTTSDVHVLGADLKKRKKKVQQEFVKAYVEMVEAAVETGVITPEGQWGEVVKTVMDRHGHRHGDDGKFTGRELANTLSDADEESTRINRVAHKIAPAKVAAERAKQGYEAARNPENQARLKAAARAHAKDTRAASKDIAVAGTLATTAGLAGAHVTPSAQTALHHFRNVKTALKSGDEAKHFAGARAFVHAAPKGAKAIGLAGLAATAGIGASAAARDAYEALSRRHKRKLRAQSTYQPYNPSTVVKAAANQRHLELIQRLIDASNYESVIPHKRQKVEKIVSQAQMRWAAVNKPEMLHEGAEKVRRNTKDPEKKKHPFKDLPEKVGKAGYYLEDGMSHAERIAHLISDHGFKPASVSTRSETIGQRLHNHEHSIKSTMAPQHRHDPPGQIPLIKSESGEAYDDVVWEGEFSKIDDEHRNVFGWASVVEVNGEPVFDHQGDWIEPADIEKAAYHYVQNSRVGGDMHRRQMVSKSPVHVSDMIESFVVTPEKIEKMGLPEGSLPTGWWVGYHVHDDATWDLVKKGERRGFSIHGVGVRKEIAPDPTYSILSKAFEESADWDEFQANCDIIGEVTNTEFFKVVGTGMRQMAGQDSKINIQQQAMQEATQMMIPQVAQEVARLQQQQFQQWLTQQQMIHADPTLGQQGPAQYRPGPTQGPVQAEGPEQYTSATS